MNQSDTPSNAPESALSGSPGGAIPALGGVKYDTGKTRYDLIPGDALDELARVYTMGAQKYQDHNWAKGMKWSRVFGAMMRHAWAAWRGEDYDPESGLLHWAHVAWGAFTLINYTRNRQEFDDRYLKGRTKK